jgi:hypothetical protein
VAEAVIVQNDDLARLQQMRAAHGDVAGAGRRPCSGQGRPAPSPCRAVGRPARVSIAPRFLTESTSALALVAGLLRDRSFTDEHGARLYAAASDLARQRAAALFDVNGQCADGAYETALRVAKAASDDTLGANCLSFWCTSAYNTGRPHDTEVMATAALASVRGRTTPRVEALLCCRRGRARAHLGDTRCWADFDRAEALLAQADGHVPHWQPDMADIHCRGLQSRAGRGLRPRRDPREIVEGPAAQGVEAAPTRVADRASVPSAPSVRFAAPAQRTATVPPTSRPRCAASASTASP